MGELISRGECELQLKVEASFNMPDTQQLEVMENYSERNRRKVFFRGFQRIKVTITKHSVKSAMQQKNIDL